MNPADGKTQAGTSPVVSIGLPTRNSIAYLEDRLESILAQTFTDWELVAVDGESTDGTWERLEQLAAADDRIKPERSAPEGIYPAFNRCVERARGRYVYIATSDDTMAPDCLEKLAGALERNPDCDLAHCPMKVIDRHGNEAPNWWTGNSLFAKSSGTWLVRPHKRIAPYDGVLCLLGDNIYSSVTQLLIRRSLFDKVGMYPTTWGSVGDFHWNLRAGLAASSVHVPDTWASWRMHELQATAAAALGSEEHTARIDGMIRDVLKKMEDGLPPGIESKAETLKVFLRKFASFPDAAGRRKYVVSEAMRGSSPAWSYLVSLVTGARWPKAAPLSIQGWMDDPIKSCA